MSLIGLVAYDSSDDSDNEVSSEEQNEQTKSLKNVVEHKENHSPVNSINDEFISSEEISKNDVKEEGITTNGFQQRSLFTDLPKPIGLQADLIEEDDDSITKISQITLASTQKNKKGPVIISFPSLSEFKDVDKEMQEKKPRIRPSTIGSGLLSALPPPSASLQSAAKLIPKVVSRKPNSTSTQIKKPPKPSEKPLNNLTSALSSIKYDSNSDDEDEEQPSTCQKGIDFFSFDKPQEIVVSEETMKAHMLPAPVERKIKAPEQIETEKFQGNQKLRSTVMNLPREEILLKNQAEIGPKLPVPEQEYNVDADGNVAFDEKAIEYLVGKRGVKRKNEFMQETNIIDINGDDMKPDERDWLVKALTEDPVQRPISLGAGPSGASKKKHQITYLAHQAKAMEVELQNQWASNKLARNQTKSKYGF